MQSCSSFLLSLYERGVTLWVADGLLRFRAPKGTLRSEDLEQLRAFKTEIIGHLERGEFAAQPPLLTGETARLAPLMPIQTYVWNMREKSGDLHSERFCTASMRLTGDLDLSALEKSIEALIQRHESLRTRFVTVNGMPRQHVDVATKFHLDVTDLSSAEPCQDVEAELQRLAELYAQQKVHLEVGPLFAAKLFRLSDSDHVLILAIDHLVSDGVSLSILDREVWTAYEQVINGRPISLPSMPMQLGDYAVWQQHTSDAWKKLHEGYWRERFNGAPSTRIPRDADSSAMKSVGEVRHFSFGRKLSLELHAIARREKAMPAFVVLTIYLAMMSRWCKEEDLTVLFVSNGRHQPDLHNLIGFLADFMYLRVRVRAAHSFTELLNAVVCEFHAANEHPGFGRLPGIISPEITDLHFNWQPYNWIPWLAERNKKISNKLTVQAFELKKVLLLSTACLPYFFETVDGIGGTIVYRPDLLSSATIERFIHESQLFVEEWAMRASTSLASVTATSIRSRALL